MTISLNWYGCLLNTSSWKRYTDGDFKLECILIINVYRKYMLIGNDIVGIIHINMK